MELPDIFHGPEGNFVFIQVVLHLVMFVIGELQRNLESFSLSWSSSPLLIDIKLIVELVFPAVNAGEVIPFLVDLFLHALKKPDPFRCPAANRSCSPTGCRSGGTRKRTDRATAAPATVSRMASWCTCSGSTSPSRSRPTAYNTPFAFPDRAQGGRLLKKRPSWQA